MSNIETEVWGEINKELFEKKLKEFTSKFGQPKKKIRFATECTDYTRHDLDTRIRITNGKPVLMQKVGDWNALSKEEIEVDLPSDAKQIVDIIRILKNLINTKSLYNAIHQTDNYLFDCDTFEIKLSHQSGKSDAYLFEVELLKEGDLIEICKNLGLEPDLSEKSDEFWNEFNKRVNLSVDDFSEEELISLIDKYLSYI